jgi:two-component system sensor histidine kinase RegB
LIRLITQTIKWILRRNPAPTRPSHNIIVTDLPPFISGFLPPSGPNDRVRLRTLILLRWVAIAGQILAAFIAFSQFNIRIDIGLYTAVIGLSVLANVVFTFVYPANKRLSERETTAILLFDTIQLALLLYIAGGLNNPFSVLIIAPVTVAATALSSRTTVIVGIIAVTLTSALALHHLPLMTLTGEELAISDLFLFGLWVAIIITILFLGAYAHRISAELRDMSQALLATQMALAREQKLTDLGGVVAAAAHELGTPLATITLVASELSDELESGSDLQEDARLIRQEADRCRDILHSMGRAGKDDLHLRQAPLGAVVEEAAEPHLDRGKQVHIIIGDETRDPADQPSILRRPEVVHGLRNLIQNAVDFAASTVWINVCWTDMGMSVRITDDGGGYPPHVIGNIGEPFMRRRRAAHGETAPTDQARPHYEGMGLGLFIAKTLLERTGAELSFANASDPYTGKPVPGEKSGAIAAVIWQRGNSREDGLEVSDKTPILGENIRFQIN